MSTYLTLLYVSNDDIDTTIPLERQWQIAPLVEDFQCNAIVREVLPECCVVTDSGTCGDIIRAFQPDAQAVLKELNDRVNRRFMTPTQDITVTNLVHLINLQSIFCCASALLDRNCTVVLRYA